MFDRLVWLPVALTRPSFWLKPWVTVRLSLRMWPPACRPSWLAWSVPPLVDDVGARHQHGALRALAADGAAAVDDAVALDVDLVAGDESTVGLQGVGAQLRQVHLGHQHLLLAAVGQGHGLAFHPDDVAGERFHLLGAERYAGAQAVLLGEGGARGQQGRVLRVVVAVA